MSKVKCVFCGNEGYRAKEHVFPLWLQNHLGIKTDQMLGSHLSISGISVSQRVQSASTILLGHVCQNCNCEWMALLEAQAASNLKNILPKPSLKATWSSDDCSTIAIWAFKTAIVLNEASNNRKIVPENHFEHLYKHRSIPNEIVVDMALDHTTKHLRWRQSQALIGSVPKSQKSRINEIMKKSYRITIGFGSILFCVAHFPLPDYVLFRSSNDYRRLWPNPKSIDFSFQSIDSVDEFDLDLFFRHSKYE